MRRIVSIIATFFIVLLLLCFYPEEDVKASGLTDWEQWRIDMKDGTVKPVGLAFYTYATGERVVEYMYFKSDSLPLYYCGGEFVTAEDTSYTIYYTNTAKAYLYYKKFNRDTGALIKSGSNVTDRTINGLHYGTYRFYNTSSTAIDFSYQVYDYFMPKDDSEKMKAYNYVMTGALGTLNKDYYVNYGTVVNEQYDASVPDVKNLRVVSDRVGDVSEANYYIIRWTGVHGYKIRAYVETLSKVGDDTYARDYNRFDGGDLDSYDGQLIQNIYDLESLSKYYDKPALTNDNTRVVSITLRHYYVDDEGRTHYGNASTFNITNNSIIPSDSDSGITGGSTVIVDGTTGEVKEEEEYDSNGNIASDSLDASDFVEQAKKGFGLLGDNGLVASLKDFFVFVPDEVWILLTSGLALVFVVIVLKAFL